jgi:beta-lactamase class A
MIADSLIRLPVVALAYKQVEEGRLSLEDSFEVSKEDVQGKAAGGLQYQPGEEISLNRLLFLSLNQSDSTAFAVLRRVLGDSAIQEEINKVGMSSTSLADNTTCANDIDLFFQKLYMGEIIKKYKDDYIFELIKSLPETRIAGIPEGVKAAFKVGGDTEAVFNAGIVFVPKKPFILTILSRGTDRQSADQMISKLTEKIYWFIVSD